MDKPKEIKKCPFCEKENVQLAIRKMKHIPKNKNVILEGGWWVYKCDTCGEGFTTTDSDTISQLNLKQRKL